MEWRGRRQDGDGGFSMIEVVVAAGILFVVLVVTAHAAVVALMDIGHSRQRQSATGLANQALEQLRALPAAVVRQGLATTDLATTDDDRIENVDGQYFYDGERVIAHTPATSDPRPPLVPHVQSLTVGPTTYEVASYVTVTGDGETLRATVEVSWADQAIRKGTSGEVVAQTLMSSAFGCGGASAENPYPAPCAADFDTAATVGRAGIIIEPADSPGSGFEFATLDLSNQESTITIGQVAVVHSEAVMSGVSLKLFGIEPATGGGAPAWADAATGTGDYAEHDTSQAAVTLPNSNTKNSVEVQSSAAAASAVSAVAARTSTGKTCLNTGGLLENDEQPCGRAHAQQTNLMTAMLAFPDATLDVADIIRVKAETAPSNVFADRAVTTGAGACSLEGCISSRAQRRVDDIQLGLIPSDLGGIADAFAGLVRVQDVDAVAFANAGEGAGAPGVAVSGTVSYWDAGNDAYASLPVAEGPAGFTTSYETTGVYTISMEGSFTVGGSSVEGPEVCELSCRRTAAAATARILQGDFTYKVVDPETLAVVADLKVTVNLGTVRATANYARPVNAF